MERSREKIIQTAYVASLFVLTVFFFGPAQMYFTNILEYSRSFLKIAPLLVGLSLVSFLVLTAVLAPLKNGIWQRTLSLFFALSLSLWVQGNVLVWDYGPLDGRDIDWTANSHRGFLDGAIWIFLAVIFILAAKKFRPFMKQASIALILIQGLSLAYVVSKAPDVSHIHDKLQLYDEEAVFQFSAERNVVILVLDAFQGDVFQEIIDEDDSYRDMLEGFTYYRNALAGYSCTFASIPLILTGYYFDNSMPASMFIRYSYSGNSIPRILLQKGYQVDLIGDKSLAADETVATNLAALSDLVDKHADLREAAFLIDLTLFRYLPHFLKRHIYRNQSWCISNLNLGETLGGFPEGQLKNSVELMKKMASRATSRSQRPTFKFIHLLTPHIPLRMNEQMEYEMMPMTRDNYKRQARGALGLANMFLEKLKELETYDETLIFIVADHGLNSAWKLGFENNETSVDAVSGIPNLERIKSSALPLFLVKPFRSSGRLRTSDAPVSLADIPKTVMTALGINARLPGVSVFKLKEADQRERRFMYYEWEWQIENANYMPMTEYYVAGFPWLDNSWRPTYKFYTAQGIKNISPETYRYGNSIQFGKSGNYLAYRGQGWAFPDERFTPTERVKASLTIPIANTSADIQLHMEFIPYLVPGTVEQQTVTIYANNEYVDEWKISQPGLQERTAVIPNEYLKDGIVNITFLLPDAVPPPEPAKYDDARKSAIIVSSIVLNELAAASVPRQN